MRIEPGLLRQRGDTTAATNRPGFSLLYAEMFVLAIYADRTDRHLEQPSPSSTALETSAAGSEPGRGKSRKDQIRYPNLHFRQSSRLISFTSAILPPPNLHLPLLHPDPTHLT